MKGRLFLLWRLQAKRLLCRPAFWLVPVLVCLLLPLFSSAAEEKGGMLTVAVAMEDPSDPVAAAATAALLDSDSSLRFVLTEPSEAREWVSTGQADAAWVFEEGTAEAVARYVRGERRPFIRIFQRGEETLLTLAKERLLGALSPSLSYELYRSYLQETFGEVDEERLASCYENAIPMEKLVVFATTDGRPVEAEDNYLRIVLRGLLSVTAVLAGMAGAMLSLEDHRRGVFALLSPWGRGVAALCAIGVAVGFVVAAMALSLFFGGLLSEKLLWEGLCLLLLIPSAAGFCLVVAAGFSRPHRFGVLLPFLLGGVLALSPVFFRMDALAPWQGFLPTYHYLYAVADPSRLFSYVLYALTAPFLGVALFRGKLMAG